QGGNGRAANGSVVNGSLTYNIVSLPVGNTSCNEGGKLWIYGNDYGNFYDSDTTLNSTEIDGHLYFCNRQVYWAATNFDFNGTISGSEQTMSYGIVPSSASEGTVSVGTLPGSALPAGADAWLNVPAMTVPSNNTRTNYSLSFDHWYHLDGAEGGAWLEYRYISSGSWTDWFWLAPDGGYPSSISGDGIVVNGAPSGNLPVFTSAHHSGWQTETVNMSSLFSDRIEFKHTKPPAKIQSFYFQ
ncbi:MAG: hypothetical protein ACJZ5P_04885, partial [Candidatus Thalassarchaeaceae archaeon]